MSAPKPDLNLLIALDVLLAEGSVAAAARRLALSPSAMSRTLARLREVTGDPLLVRAGRGLMPTPRAAELREVVGRIVRDASAALGPSQVPDLARLERTFVIRAVDSFVETYGLPLFTRIRAEAPGMRLRFIGKLEKDERPPREEGVDLEVDVLRDSTAPDFRTRALFDDRFIGVARSGHPLVSGEITAERYARGPHVDIWRHVPKGAMELGPIDGALATLGLRRDIAVVVGGFASALALARRSDLVATVPARNTHLQTEGMATFDLPFATPPLRLYMLWHPWVDADPVHQWLRSCLWEVCQATGR